jgi:hypothetical protein
MDASSPSEYCLCKDDIQAITEASIYTGDQFQRYTPTWRGIFGWLYENQAEWLFNQAKETNIKGEIVEIGSAFGRSTIALGLGAKLSLNGKVHAIDPHTGDKAIQERIGLSGEKIQYNSLEGFQKNIYRFDLANYIVPIVKTSEGAVKEWGKGPLPQKNIRLLFVDGWHSHDAVYYDITEWGKHMVYKGLIAVHDYENEEIKKAVHEGMRKLSIMETELQKIDKNMVFFPIK